MKHRLTSKQQAFVEAYLRLQNGRKAYKEVYDKCGKMSDAVADAAAARMLRFVKVYEAIKARQKSLKL